MTYTNEATKAAIINPDAMTPEAFAAALDQMTLEEFLMVGTGEPQSAPAPVQGCMTDLDAFLAEPF